MQTELDLNCDMGESFGAWKMGDDEAIMPFVSSVNIACGFHAGDPATMRRTVAAALRHGVAIGAHPGLPDLGGFGRRVMAISEQEAYDIVVVQIGALAAVARSQGARLHHAKMHGALYNMAVKDTALARAVVRAVHDVDPALVFYAQVPSEMSRHARELGLRVAGEVFADRTYQTDGSLTPRSRPGAMIVDVDRSIAQVMQMLEHGRVTSLEGADVAVQPDTLCIHGDQPGAVVFAKAIRAALEARDIRIARTAGRVAGAA